MIGASRPTISRNEIIEKVSEADIIGYYLGITSIPALINSPFRQDENPSFALYSPNGKDVNYKDHATDEVGGCMTLLMKLWNCNRSEVYSKIQKDLLLFNKVECTKSALPNVRRVKINAKCELQCTKRDWMKHDIEYWESFGIPLTWLKYAEVYPISHKIIIKDGKKMVFGADKYAYAFVERKEGKVTLKLYQPFNKSGYKWQNSHDKSVLGLWTKIPKTGDKVVICSSVKDALCLAANMHLPSVCLQGEGYPVSDTAIKELKRRFKEVYICLDNDETGIKDARKLSEELDAINVVIPSFEGGKDISDFYKIHGKEAFVTLFTKIFTEAYNEYINTLPF